jgi:hypothetical protein
MTNWWPTGGGWLELASRAQFSIGDAAVEIEPIRPRGGSQAGPGEESGVDETLARYADDIGLSLSTVRSYRFVASRWPTERRVKGVSHKVHMILASIEDEAERFEAIVSPPPNPRTGELRWTTDTAKRRVGQKVAVPVTREEKILAVTDLVRDEKVAVSVATDLLRRPEVTAKVAKENKVNVISDLARDDQVAATVATDLLRRPKVAAKVVEDDTTRQVVNRAQVERVERAGAAVRRANPQIARAAEKVAHTKGFVELVGCCHAFVAQVGRVVPTLSGWHFTEAERGVLNMNVAKVRGAAEWVEHAVDTGNVDLDQGFAALLRGE